MENNRLNINRPLLSVRRRTSSLTNERRKESCLPVKSSVESRTTELTADWLWNTGSVPFGWEHSPGRPKNKQVQTMESPPSLPKLPPGRFLKPMKNDSVTNVSKITKSESMESTKKESFDSRGHDADVDGNDDDDDEAYVDALDTLSRGETSFYNCSASGVSGVWSDVKPSGGSDPTIRDFMMGRFLPAAKAMASDLPQHSFKKNISKQKPQEVKKLVNTDDNNKMKLRYGPNFLEDDVNRDKEEAAHNDENDDDSDYDYNDHGNKSSKLCGLIPRFYSVNPIHGMCVRARLPASPAKRTQTSSSSSNSFREIDSEPARNATYRHRSLNSVLKIESTETSSLEGLKLYNRLQGNGNSVDLSGSFQSTVSEQSDSSSKKKGVSFKELLADKNTNETEADSQESIIEKTLYVDTVHIIKSPQENTSPLCMKPQSIFDEALKSDVFVDESEHDLETKEYEGPEVGSEVLDVNGDKQLKAYETRVFELPVPPPLPKSPLDSWLGRTLPSMSSKNAHMRWNNRYPPSNPVVNDLKTDDKFRLRNPQGQLHPIPES